MKKERYSSLTHTLLPGEEPVIEYSIRLMSFSENMKDAFASLLVWPYKVFASAVFGDASLLE